MKTSRVKTLFAMVATFVLTNVFSGSRLLSAEEKLNVNFLSYDPKVIPKLQTMELKQGGEEIKPVETSYAGDVLAKVAQAPIMAVENVLKGTCAKEAKISLYADGEGKIYIVNLGVGGSMEVVISNPKKGKYCN